MTEAEAKMVITTCNPKTEDEGKYRAGDIILLGQIASKFTQNNPKEIMDELERLGYVQYTKPDVTTNAVPGYRLTETGAILANS